MKIARALIDRIIVRLIDDSGEKTTNSGLVIPSSVKDPKLNLALAEVVSVGPGLEDTVTHGVPSMESQPGMPRFLLAPCKVKPGDVVLTHAYSQFPFELSGERYSIVGARDVWAVVEDGAETK